jgi:hypothetical protein
MVTGGFAVPATLLASAEKIVGNRPLPLMMLWTAPAPGT